jgi:hypothetical protein
VVQEFQSLQHGRQSSTENEKQIDFSCLRKWLKGKKTDFHLLECCGKWYRLCVIVIFVTFLSGMMAFCGREETVRCGNKVVVDKLRS